MHTAEQEVIDKFRQLDHSAQQRVLVLMAREVSDDPAAFDYAAWWAAVDRLQADIRARIGDTGTIGALSLLDDLRG